MPASGGSGYRWNPAFFPPPTWHHHRYTKVCLGQWSSCWRAQAKTDPHLDDPFALTCLSYFFCKTDQQVPTEPWGLEGGGYWRTPHARVEGYQQAVEFLLWLPGESCICSHNRTLQFDVLETAEMWVQGQLLSYINSGEWFKKPW